MREVLHHILARPIAFGMACCAVAAGGLLGLSGLPLGLAPTLEFPALSIHTSWGNAPAERIEQIITAPIEEIVSSIRGVRKVRSTSREGHSRVSIEFDPQTNMNFARLEMNEQLAMFARQLPRNVSHPVVEPYVPDDIEQLQGFLVYSLAGAVSRASLARIADHEIIPRLMSIEGVSQVILQGEDEEELLVELSPDKLSACSVAFGEVVTALEGTVPGGKKGTLQGPAGIQEIDLAGEEGSLSQIERIPIRRTDRSSSVRLCDVGTAGIVSAAPREILRVNGKQCLTLTVVRDPNSSLLRTAEAVRSCLAELGPHLPADVELVCEQDRSLRMETELHLLYRDSLLSLILLWGILALFLGAGKTPLVLISSVFLSVAGTLLALWILQVPLHLLTLAGLVLGMGRLLDDSIVVLENLRRWTERGTTVEAILDGTSEVALPVAASTVAMAGAIAPLLFLPKELQLYIREFAIAVNVSLFMSGVASLAVIPSAMLRWKTEGNGILVHPRGAVASAYGRVLHGALRHRTLVLLVAVWAFGLPVWLLPSRIEGNSLMAAVYNRTIGGSWYASVRPLVNAVAGGASYQFFSKVPLAEFLDPGKETYLVMQLDFPQGTAPSHADVFARVLEQDLLQAGAPRLTTRVMDRSIIFRIDFPDSVAATPFPAILQGRCIRLAAQTGGATVSVAGFGAGFSGGVERQPAFTVRVLGYDYSRVRQIAESLRERLSQNPRVASADIDRSFGDWSRSQEIALSLDRDAGTRYGFAHKDVAATLRERTEALPLRTRIPLQGATLPCVVMIKGVDRFSVADLASLKVEGTDNVLVPMRSVLGIRQRAAPSEIVREDQQYVRWVSFEYKGPYRHAQAFLDATIRTFPLPEGYRFDRSDISELSGHKDALLLAALASLLAVFMVTASLYESLLDPFIIMLSVPFAFIGVFLAFVLGGMPFGKGGYLSVIFLTGIAVANAIVIVDFIGKMQKQGGGSIESIVEASVCRLRPVLMTTCVTVGSLVPMLFGDRSSIWYGMALGAIGGIVSSAMLTLVVVPVVYALTHEINSPPTPSLG